MRPPPARGTGGGGVEVDNQVNSKPTSTTPGPLLQAAPPFDFDPAAFPILATHWFLIEGARP